MPRPRSFDRSDVLDRALEAFWRQGYEATSVQDLVDAMGLSRASLYNAFGSKHALFVEVLKHYEAQRLNEMVEQLRDPSTPAKTAIHGVLEQAAEAATPDARGCLITNTATEMCARDADCVARVQAALTRIEAAFEAALRRGQDTGASPSDQGVRALARYLTNALQGLRVLAAAHTDRDTLDDVINVTMQVID